MFKKAKKGEYIELLLRSGKTVFSARDMSLIWKEPIDSKARVRINDYVKNKKLIHIYRGFYAKDKKYNRLELANKIYTPSYISFETVLGRAGIVFQYYENIFVATYVRRDIKINKQTISYVGVKDSVLFNTKGVEQKNNIAIATKERAFLDRVYVSKDYYFDNLGALNWNKVFAILPIYSNKKMNKRVNNYYKEFKKT